jgi:hypothetical protein
VWNQTEIDSKSVHKNVKCQQDKPQHNKKALDDMAIFTEEQRKYRLHAKYFHPFSHTCNTGHVNYRLQFIYHNTTYNIWTSTQYNIINSNTKFNKDQLEVQSVTTSRYMYICISKR